MERYYTSIEQSKRLLELGLKPETADMFYTLRHREGIANVIPVAKPYSDYIKDSLDYNPTYDPKLGKLLPCWSVGRLIQFVKDTIQVEGQTWAGVHLSFDHIGVDKDDDYTIQFDGHYDCFELNNLSLIDIVVELTERVLKNDRLFT